ncbi:diacylglycerol kinase family protein [Nocardioides sp. YIM 152588]|uniref:diacylglycerol/lipid kinase family protein n=1 Tax=Nocardioides sp. YIM 152588 TaxID=3158259 RepID=UPI0032E42773
MVSPPVSPQRSPGQRRVLVIANSGAGTAAEETLDAALAVLREHAEVEVARTGSPEELDRVLAGLGERRVVVVGGDGSIHAVVAALHRAGDLAGREIGLVPLGTGNDFARTLDLPLEPAAAAQVVATGRAQPVDLVVDDGADGDRVTVNGVHIGAGAAAGERGAAWKQRLGRVGVGKVNLGRLGYPIGALQTAVRPPTLRVRVEVDGRVVEDGEHRVLQVALGNGSSVGGGTELTPGARPNDGQVDVLVARPERTLARLGYLLRLPFARHGEHREVTLLRGAEVSITDLRAAAGRGEGFDCNSDGEIDGPVRRRTWRVLPSAYAMVVPGADRESEAGPRGD